MKWKILNFFHRDKNLNWFFFQEEKQRKEETRNNKRTQSIQQQVKWSKQRSNSKQVSRGSASSLRRMLRTIPCWPKANSGAPQVPSGDWQIKRNSKNQHLTWGSHAWSQIKQGWSEAPSHWNLKMVRSTLPWREK